MDAVTFVGLALIVAIVAIDALARAPLAPRSSPTKRDPAELVSTEKIEIDLSQR
jgi:hypothetical protein